LVNNTGLSFEVITNLINKYGVKVKVTPIKKEISNIEGDELLLELPSYSEIIFFSRKNTNWNQNNIGLIEGADAIGIIKSDSVIKKDFKILHNGNNYRVQSVINRDQGGGVVMFKTITLFLI